MIYFFADDHYNVSPGKEIYNHLPETLKKRIRFFENDWSLLESGDWLADCELLILNMIGSTCNQPHPGCGAERAVRAWCERGGNALLLHGSSAAGGGKSSVSGGSARTIPMESPPPRTRKNRISSGLQSAVTR